MFSSPLIPQLQNRYRSNIDLDLEHFEHQSFWIRYKIRSMKLVRWFMFEEGGWVRKTSQFALFIFLHRLLFYISGRKICFTYKYVQLDIYQVEHIYSFLKLYLSRMICNIFFYQKWIYLLNHYLSKEWMIHSCLSGLTFYNLHVYVIIFRLRFRLRNLYIFLLWGWQWWTQYCKLCRYDDGYRY